jgi:hypothetical protein
MSHRCEVCLAIIGAILARLGGARLGQPGMPEPPLLEPPVGRPAKKLQIVQAAQIVDGGPGWERARPLVLAAVDTDVLDGHPAAAAAEPVEHGPGRDRALHHGPRAAIDPHPSGHERRQPPGRGVPARSVVRGDLIGGAVDLEHRHRVRGAAPWLSVVAALDGRDRLERL